MIQANRHFEQRRFYSIVVTVYNCQAYLGECLASIERQEFGGFEVILVDDGSSDGSGEVCDAFCKTHGWAKVVHKANEGAMHARVCGVRNASGSHIMFIDADDALRDDALRTLDSCIERHPETDILAFSFSRRADFSSDDTYFKLDPGLYGRSEMKIIREAACSGRFHFVWGRVFSRHLFSAWDGMEEWGRMAGTEDWPQFLLLLDKASTFEVTDEVLYYYRPNDVSITNTYNRQAPESLALAFHYAKGFALKWGESCQAKINDAARELIFSLVYTIGKSIESKSSRLEEYKRAYVLLRAEKLVISRGTSFLDHYHFLILNQLSNRRFLCFDELIRLHVRLKSFSAANGTARRTQRALGPRNR